MDVNVLTFVDIHVKKHAMMTLVVNGIIMPVLVIIKVEKLESNEAIALLAFELGRPKNLKNLFNNSITITIKRSNEGKMNKDNNNCVQRSEGKHNKIFFFIK